MGKQKLKLSSVKGYREKRKARLAAREAPTSNNQATDLLVSLPRVLSFKQLCDHFSKSDIPGWTVVENTAERLTLAKMKTNDHKCNFYTLSQLLLSRDKTFH